MIVLLGVPRAGKTTLGCHLAETLEIPFYDLDELVLKKSISLSQKIDSPRTLVELYGEPMLRTLEKEAILNLQDCKEGVLALGGGTLLGEFNLSEIIPQGIYFHLSIPFTLFLERVLIKQLPATCKTHLGWYRGLHEFYRARHLASSKVCHHTIDGACDAHEGLERILMQFPQQTPR